MSDTYSATKRSEVMSRVRTRDTTPEMAVRSTLHRMGLRFRLHREDLPGTPDLVLPKHNLVIWVHGCFWHGHSCSKGSRPQSNKAFWDSKLDRNEERDREAQEAIRALGWRSIVVWECETTEEGALEDRLRAKLRDVGVC